MLFDFLDNYRVAEAVRTVEHLKKATRIPNPFAAQKSDIEALQLEIGELRLQVAVLYRLLITRGLFTEAEIHELINSLDLADGKSDGQFDGDPVTGTPTPVPPITYPEIRTS